ncbi:MAG: hypothetical protein AB7G23_04695 [Vicinamibacterales bacterium]
MHSASRPVEHAGSGLRILFRAPAGRRRGFGHLVRCVALARAAGVRPLVALRGGHDTILAALRLGADVLDNPSPAVVAALRPDVVVIDDPVPGHARTWVRAARAGGSRVVTVHDLGLGAPEGDLVVDGSLCRHARPRRPGLGLLGTSYAVIDPTIAARPRGGPRPPAAEPPSILVSLGGGPHARRAEALVQALRREVPQARIRVAAGFVTPARRTADTHVTWIVPARGLADELRSATVAVLAGGVSLYEACALGTPTVAMPVVRSQAPTVRALAARRAIVGLPFNAAAARSARDIARLLDDEGRRQALSATAQRLIDGRGAARVARALAALAERRAA